MAAFPSALPEPQAWAMSLAGLALLAWRRRRAMRIEDPAAGGRLISS